MASSETKFHPVNISCLSQMELDGKINKSFPVHPVLNCQFSLKMYSMFFWEEHFKTHSKSLWIPFTRSVAFKVSFMLEILDYTRNVILGWPLHLYSEH